MSRRPPNTVEKAHSASILGPNAPLENTPHKAGNGDLPITCPNRHCPKCQSLARAVWLEKRQAELLPVEYHHVVFTLPERLAALAFQNKKQMYGLLFRATAETLQSIAADRKHLGAASPKPSNANVPGSGISSIGVRTSLSLRRLLGPHRRSLHAR